MYICILLTRKLNMGLDIVLYISCMLFIKTLFFYVFNYGLTGPNWWQHCHLKLIASLKLLVVIEINLSDMFFCRLGLYEKNLLKVYFSGITEIFEKRLVPYMALLKCRFIGLIRNPWMENFHNDPQFLC